MRGQQLGMAEYQEKVNLLSLEWRRLSQQDREDFVVQATYEEQTRARLSECALPTKGQLELEHSDSDPALRVRAEMEQEVGKKGLSKISCKRLAVNEELYRSHDLWSSPTQMGDGFLPEVVVKSEVKPSNKWGIRS